MTDANEIGREGDSGSASLKVAGTVVILGRPNVGKSTLLNALLGEKLAIVTPKPQTTRNRIVGVWNGTSTLPQGDPRGVGHAVQGQIVFIDTPGVHVARSKLNRFMVREAMGAIEEVDAALLVVETKENTKALPLASRLPEIERRILERLKDAGKKTVLCLNKVDQVKDKGALLPILEGWEKLAFFSAIVPTSATKKSGLPGLIRELLGLLPTGEPLYGPEVLTDRTERFLAGELVREQVFFRLYEELPYATAVTVENWQERDQGDVMIDASIVVERESQKAIVVGRGGAMIREVGTSARKEISELLGRPVHLRLYVKVKEDWTASDNDLADLGYHEDKR